MRLSAGGRREFVQQELETGMLASAEERKGRGQGSVCAAAAWSRDV